MKALLMGLGLHGGGLESARYLLRHGADLTVTDLREEKALLPSIEQLEAACRESPRRPVIRYVLGRHEMDDFAAADMVIKNPGVRPDSPFLRAARRIETDISLFLNGIGNSERLLAVTGSKGKSSTASALHWALTHSGGNGRTYLGGNITVSPLTFLDELRQGDQVILELSSWQLGDLKGRFRTGGDSGTEKIPLVQPQAAVLTAIMPDHLDWYGSMEQYIADKRVIYQGQNTGDITVAGDDHWGHRFLAESKAAPLVYAEAAIPKGKSGGWIDDPSGPGYAQLYGIASPYLAEGTVTELVPPEPLVPGLHQKRNLLAAGLAMLGLGFNPETIREGLGSFPGIEHRLERFHQTRGITFYNDSAATIPEAAAAAIQALSVDGTSRLIVITGGTDKNLDFTTLAQAVGQAKAVMLLAGSGSEKLRALLNNAGVSYCGPFDELDKAVTAALAAAAPGDRVLLSPGCASFGMFLNEFDRGRKWKEAVRRLA